MGQKPLIYAFVSRGTVLLSEYTEFSGNFNSIAFQCLQKLPASNNKFTYNCDGHTFNYLVDNGYSEFFIFSSFPHFLSNRLGLYALSVRWLTDCLCYFVAYCVVADESAGRQVPMAFLERIKEDFMTKYGSGKATTATANSLNKEFGPKLKEHMQYCVDHPEEISKLAKVKAQVSEVKGVMMENIEKVLDRGEKIELLVDKTENLHQQAQDFRSTGTKIRRKMWLQNMKIKLIVLGIIIALILIIVLSICKGFNCGKK
ncbi:Putative vesicle-associated membrane protein 726 [Linum grandiflorum]